MSTGKTYSTKYLLDSKNNRGSEGQVLSSTNSGIDWVTLSEISGVDGTGTANYLSKWLDANTITNSLVYDNGTNVGIGTTTPAEKLELFSASDVALRIHKSSVGEFRMGVAGSAGSDTAQFVTNTNGFDFRGDSNTFPDGGSSRLFISSSGNVGIGTTSPTSPLTIKSNSVSSSGSALTIQGNSNTNAIVRIAEKSTDGARFHMYDGGVEKIAFYTDGTANHISAGNVGIGTTSPSGNGSKTTLHINSDTNGSAIRLTQAGNSALIRYDNTDGLQVGTIASKKLSFETGDTTAITIDTSQNVGIGTTSPATKLHILTSNVGASTLYADVAIEAVDAQLDLTSSSGGSWGSAINFVEGASASANTDVWSIARQTTGGSGDSSLRFNFGTSNKHSNDSKITFTSSGNVGIGILAPTFKLHVKSDDSNDDIAYIHHDNPSQSSGTVLKVRSDAGDSSGYSLLDVSNNTGNALYVRGDRNVGIGTTSPAGILEIAGNTDTNSNFLIIRDKDPTAGSARPSIRFAKLDGTVLGQLLALDGTNQRLQFSGDNTEDPHLTVYNNGNVGIGTTGPNANLHVFSTGNGEIEVQRSGGALINLQAQASKGIIGTDTNHRLDLKTNGGVRMTIEPAGNVGIGTTGPNAKLHTKVGTSNSAAYDSSVGLLVEGGTRGIVQINSTSDAYFMFGDAAQLNRAWFGYNHATDQLLLHTGSTISMDGNVGIGTTSPARKLTIKTSTGSRNNAIGINDASGTEQATIALDTNTNDVSIAGKANLRFYSGSTLGGVATLPTNERVVITTAGNVGIGTTDPTADLYINSSNNIGLTLEHASRPTISLTDGTNTGFIGLDNGGAIITGTSDNDLAIRSPRNIVFGGNSFARMSITNAGNVGIGTTNPAVDLQIGDGTADKTLRVFHSDNTYTQISGYGLFMSRGSSYIRPTADNSKGLYIGSSNYQWNLIAQDATNHTFSTNGSESVRITSAGNVGIGTTSPQASLHVAGNLPTTPTGNGVLMGLYTSGSSNYGNIQLNGDTGSFIDFSSSGTDWKGRILYNNSSNYMRFDTGGTERVRINSSGYVGIGTTNPAAILDVKSGMSAFETTLTNNNDWENSAISILERDNVGSAQSADKYSPNLNFHWSGRVSNSLWMNSSGHLNWGSFGSNGIPNADGVFQTNTINLIGTGRITGVDTVSASTDAANKAYVDAQVGSVDTLQEVTDNGNTTTNSIGIGTTSAEVKLHVGTSTLGTAPDTNADIISSGGITIDDNRRLSFDTNYYVHGNIRYATSGTTEAKLEYQGHYGHNFITRSSSKMVISGNTGNVGIGTTSPSQKLDVVGHIEANTANANFRAIDGSVITKLQSQTVGGPSQGVIGTESANNLAIVTSNQTRMLINTSGNVGIGTTASLDSLLNVGSPSATNVKVSRIAGDTTTVYHYGSSADATLEWTCGSYFNAEVVITASQTNGGTYNNLYIRGIWSNNHTSHHWDELEHVGSLTGTTFTITNGQNGSTAASGRLTLGVDYVNGSFATLNIRITDFFGTHAYTIT
jgi:hypothetical protein